MRYPQLCFRSRYLLHLRRRCGSLPLSNILQRPVLFTSSFLAERRSASRAAPIQCYCVRSWRVCISDRTAHRNEDMDRRRRDRHAARLPRSQCSSADGASATTVLRSRLRFSWTSRRHRQAVVVRRRRSLFVCQASGARTIHLAASYRRHRLFDSRAVIDVTRRHRLAKAAEDLGATDRSVSYTRDSPVFMRLLLMFSTSFHGILRSWLLLSCQISISSTSKR